MRRFNDVYYAYKQDTGNGEPMETEIQVFRSKGQWILDTTDQDMLRLIGLYNVIDIPDIEYIEWLEDKVRSIINPINSKL